jgi:hypothetical protein
MAAPARSKEQQVGTSCGDGAGNPDMLRPGEVSGFMAYNCANTTSLVDVYSLLEPATCPSSSPQYAVERTIFGEIVLIKSEQRVPVFRCQGIETVKTQYCGLLSVGGVFRYLYRMLN